MPADSASHPRITVVTPSFNQAAYLEATILSVLGQRYPDLEYFVYDGGSTDGSEAVIKRYESELAGWVCERDEGQSDAINRAFERSTGDILCWLNSDDLHWAHTLREVARCLAGRTEQPIIISGGCVIFHEGENRGGIIAPTPHDPERLKRCDYIVQPSTFWTRAAWQQVGKLDQSLHYAFDWDWFLRALPICRFETVPAILSSYRIHSQHKSSGGSSKRRAEIEGVLTRMGQTRHLELYRWLAGREDLWPGLSRFGHLRRTGFPAYAALGFTPRLWPLGLSFRMDDVLDAFHML
jgi:glycosyltransferase involved in cell wall biosynthesis